MLDPQGPWVARRERAALPRPAASRCATRVESMRALERATLETPGVEGVVLRYGFFYGAGHVYAPDGSMARRHPQAPDAGRRQRRGPLLVHPRRRRRRRDGRWRSTTARPASTTSPTTSRRCSASGCASSRAIARRAEAARVPLWLGRLVAGPLALGAVSLRGASNAKARRELGWTPAHPDWRAGFAEVFGAARLGER